MMRSAQSSLRRMIANLARGWLRRMVGAWCTQCREGSHISTLAQSTARIRAELEVEVREREAALRREQHAQRVWWALEA